MSAQPRAIRRHLAAMVVVALLSAGAHPSPPSRPLRSPRPPAGRVAMVGDSITWMSRVALDRALAGAPRSVDGIGGIDLVAGRARLVRPAVARHPRALIIELGTNNARDGWSAADERAVDDVLADVAPVACVLWITPTARPTSDFDAFAPGTMRGRMAQARRSVQRRLPTHPRLHVADWGAIEGRHPDWFEHDGLHPNHAGQQALASFVAQQLARQCPSPA